MTADPTALHEIASNTVSRYNERFARYGYDARSLGWGSTEQQRYRFAQTLAGPIDFGQKSLLDIGCGFGDYCNFLREARQDFTHYEGWDVNPDLIAEAMKRRAADSNTSFSVRNLMDPALDERTLRSASDIGVMLGVLNFNLAGKMDNYAYSELAIRRAWALSAQGLIVDFLSVCRNPGSPTEPWVFYHNPERMLSFALSLSPRVTLKHDYLPIPQREFMLFIERE